MATHARADIEYPERDGLPMSDNPLARAEGDFDTVESPIPAKEVPRGRLGGVPVQVHRRDLEPTRKA
jgi:hypothetical protein